MTADWDALLAQALDNLPRDYPIHWTQTIGGPQELRPHRDLHPMFGGSWDWHSCVHQTWLVVRLLRLRRPVDPATAAAAAALLDRLLTPAHGEIEAAYFADPRTASWERPYGWAWLLTLDAELRCWAAAEATAPSGTAAAPQATHPARWEQAVAPLRDTLRQGWLRWAASLTRPVRVGTHANTAFAAGLVLDAARATEDVELAAATEAMALRLFVADQRYGAYEPDAADFLSPALIEADLVRRLLPQARFVEWFEHFLPDLAAERWAVLRDPVAIAEGSDPQGAHLIGLDLSRAWCWRAIADALPADHHFAPLAGRAAAAHREVGWRSVFGEGYAATHWVGSFALYLELGALRP